LVIQTVREQLMVAASDRGQSRIKELLDTIPMFLRAPRALISPLAQPSLEGKSSQRRIALIDWNAGSAPDAAELRSAQAHA
jgi:hypothetical protein